MTPLRTATILLIVALGPGAWHSSFAETADDRAVREAVRVWRRAGYPGKGALQEAVYNGARRASRPDIVEMVLTGGPVMRKMLTVPKGGRTMPLEVLRTFRDFSARLDDEMFGSFGHQEGWLARRLTDNRIEVWTPKHGWLFDGRGRLIHEARPPRRSGQGREWYGAFLPDGRWVTTDLDDTDNTLSFFSANGTCSER